MGDKREVLEIIKNFGLIDILINSIEEGNPPKSILAFLEVIENFLLLGSNLKDELAENPILKALRNAPNALTKL